MACCTPVVALGRASVPEIVRDGVTGFVCSSVSELASAIGRVDEIDPGRCRLHAFASFDVDTMVDAYEAVYRRVAAREPLADRIAPWPEPPPKEADDIAAVG